MIQMGTIISINVSESGGSAQATIKNRNYQL